MNHRLHLRMLGIALLPVTLVAIGLSATMLNIGSRNLEDALDLHNTAQVRQLASAVEFPLVAGNQTLLEATARQVLDADPDASAVAIFDAEGRSLVQLGALPAGAAGLAADTPQIHRIGDHSVLIQTVLPPNLPLDDYYAETQPDSAAKPLGKVILVISHQRLIEQRNVQLRLAAFLTLIGAAMGTLLAFGMANGIRKVLADATDVVMRIGRGHLDARMKVSSSSALVDLALGVNQMAQRVAWSHQDLSDGIASATAQISAERDLATRATEAKTRFLASASHDLRQPLHALSLFTEHALELQSPAEQTAWLMKIATTVGQLRALLDSLLDLSRLETGEATPQLEDFSLDARLKRCCESLTHLANSKGISLRSRLLPTLVHSDPFLLDRIALNLISNAIRYTDHGGVLVTCRRYRGKIRVQVWDTGIGIAMESQQVVFDDYVQLGNVERSQDKGLGLGLAICRLAAGLLGSEVHVRSSLGRGSVFWLDLADASAGAASPGTDQTPTSAAAFGADPMATSILPLCLILDSDPLRGAANSDLLRRLFGRVVVVSSAGEVLQLCRSACPDVILFECSVDNLGARLALMVAIGQDYPTVRRVILACELDREARAQLSASGAIVLQSPVQAGRLRAALQANPLDSGK